MWVEFSCKLDNELIVLADQDRMVSEITYYIESFLEYHNVRVFSVDTFYNRKLERGVVHCISDYFDFKILPMKFTTHTHAADIIFHGS